MIGGVFFLKSRLFSGWLRIGLFCLFLFGCRASHDSPLGNSAGMGITDQEIHIGSSLALKGHAGYLGTQMLQGALAYIRHVNETGGVHGRLIRITALDDGYDPPRCLYNTQRLILDKKVFALLCYVGTPTTVSIVPLINDAQIPLVGMLTGASRLRDPVNPFLINIRASYYQETEAAVKYMVETLGVTKVAVFYQYDEYGFDGLRGTEMALKRYGIKPVAKGSYIRGSLDVESGLNQIALSKAQAVVMIGTSDPCARFIRLAKARGFAPLFHNVSFVGSEELARRLGDAGEGVIMTQVVPPPISHNELLPGVREYAEFLARYYPGSRPTFVGLEGYLNARVLVEGLRRVGRDLTRKTFVQAVESINKFDLGISNTLSFGRNDHQGLDRVYFTRINNHRIELLP